MASEPDVSFHRDANGQPLGLPDPTGLDTSGATAASGAPAGAAAIRSHGPCVPLTGELRDFRAHDICQLLQMTEATGVLRIVSLGVRGEIFIEHGNVVGARCRPNPQRLGRLLRQSGVIDAATLESVLEAKIDGHRARLGELLVARGVIDGAVLARALDQQVEAAAAALLVLPVGRFAFVTGELPGALRRIVVDPQALVMESLARLDELRAGS